MLPPGLGAGPSWSDDLASQHSPLAQIRRENVKQLKVAWTYRTGEPLVPAGGGRPPAFEATAVYFQGLLYVSSPYGKVAALEPETGKERWAFDGQIDRKGNYGDFVSRGVVAWRDASTKRDRASAATGSSSRASTRDSSPWMPPPACGARASAPRA